MENLLKVEVEKRMNERLSASKALSDITKGHIYKDKEGIEYVDPNLFNDVRNNEVARQAMGADIRYLIVSEYIYDHTDLELDGVLSRTSEEQIERYNSLYDGNPLVDYSDDQTKDRFASIMGEKFNLYQMNDITPGEMKEMYYSMITNAMLVKGLTGEQINEWINEAAISVGCKEKSETKKM